MRTDSFLVRRTTRRGGFTLIELLVVISIVAVLASILLPTLSSVQESGRSTRCISNLREIGAALNLYANDNNNCYPSINNASGDWDATSIVPYLPARTLNGQQSTLFICPDANFKNPVVANSSISRAYSVTDCMVGPPPAYSFKSPEPRALFASAASSLLLFDSCQAAGYRYSNACVTWTQLKSTADLQPTGTTGTYIDYRHRNAFHALYADGRVDTITRANAASVITQVMWQGFIRQ